MYHLQIEGMSCAHCVGAITKAVKEVDPDAWVEVDLATKDVKINSSGALDRIKAAITEAGYDIISAA